MANRRTGAPGGGGAPRTVALRRVGVCSGARPRTRTGAITTRAPRSPRLSTSTTQPSMTVGSLIAGATGSATIKVRVLAAARPQARQASISSGRVQRRDRPRRLAPSQAPTVTTAASNSGHSDGSVFRAK